MTTFKTYSDWLFESNKVPLNERIISDHLLEEGFLDDLDDATVLWTQLGLSAIGLIPGLGVPADVANILISFDRQDWLGVALGLLGMLPVLGDAIGNVGNMLRFSIGIADSGSITIARPIILHMIQFVERTPNILSYINRIDSFIASTSTEIINLFRSARSGTAMAGMSEALRPLLAVVNDSRVVSMLRGPTGDNILTGLGVAFRNIRRILNSLASIFNTVGRAAANAETIERVYRVLVEPEVMPAAPASTDTPTGTLSENFIYTDIRFKRLARIL